MKQIWQVYPCITKSQQQQNTYEYLVLFLNSIYIYSQKLLSNEKEKNRAKQYFVPFVANKQNKQKNHT
jgi:hypothetical protein